MENNTRLVQEFYSAFQQLDAKGMNRCYADDIFFFDPAFGQLRGDEVKAMWAMLCKNAQSFSLQFNNIQELDHEYVTCDWVATYLFSKTGKTVVNKVRANMRIANGMIIEHSDAFSLHQWSRQALGFWGSLLGWNSFFQQKIRNKARKQLLRYLQQSMPPDEH